MSDPIGASCKRDYDAYHTSGRRPLSAVKWVVLHDTEGGTARSIARYFSTSSSGGSTHLVLDDNECYRCLDNNQVPWGAKGANYAGFHIEQCGFAHWTQATWMSHKSMLHRAAYKTALHCHRFNIPVRFCTAAMLKEGRRGITTHAECSKAFGGTHSDPGKNYPLQHVMRLTAYYYNQLGKQGL